ncbi:MAG: DUF2208 domain-containing protein [Acidilobus sp.]
MSYIERMGRLIGLNQLYIVIYSALAAVIGVNIYLFLLIFVFIAVSMIVQSVMMSSNLNEKGGYVPEILSGRRLFHEDNTRAIQTKDQMIYLDLQEQTKFSLYTTFGVLIGLAYFFALWRYVPDFAVLLAVKMYGTTVKDLTFWEARSALLLAFLLYFEGYFVINQGIMTWALKRVRKLPALNVPTSFIVTDRGVVIKGFVTTKGIRFPLPPDVRLNLDKNRRFVELVREGKRTVTKLRFYTRNPEKLYDVLRRVAYGPQQPA